MEHPWNDDNGERRSMRVLSLVTNEYAPFYRDQISALSRKGIQVTTLSPGQQSPDFATQSSIERSPIDYVSLYFDVLAHQFRSYDLVHANYGLTALFTLPQRHRPAVLTLWGSDLNGDLGRLSATLAKRFDEVIVMSEEMNARLDGDATVIPHGVDFELFAPRPQADAQRHLGWDLDAKHVLFPYDPARPVKNYPLAERVVSDVRRRLNRRVEFHSGPSVAHEMMPRYLNAADALLITSDHEGSPNTVKEALACNLPVVSTDVGDVRERLDGVEPSAVCSTETELIEALQGVLEQDRRSNGRERIRDLSLDRMGDRIYDVYRRALK